VRKIKRIVIHCSASPQEVNGKMIDVEDVDRWHRDRGWKCCGYHAVIIKTGQVQRGRSDEEEGAHAKGANKDSLGVCLIGDDCFTVAQLVSLRGLLKMWMTQYHLNSKDIYCHYQLNSNKTCPNFRWEDIRELFFKQ